MAAPALIGGYCSRSGFARTRVCVCVCVCVCVVEKIVGKCVCLSMLEIVCEREFECQIVGHFVCV